MASSLNLPSTDDPSRLCYFLYFVLFFLFTGHIQFFAGNCISIHAEDVLGSINVNNRWYYEEGRKEEKNCLSIRYCKKPVKLVLRTSWVSGY